MPHIVYVVSYLSVPDALARQIVGVFFSLDKARSVFNSLPPALDPSLVRCTLVDGNPVFVPERPVAKKF